MTSFTGSSSVLNPRRPDGTIPNGACGTCHNGVPEGQAPDPTGVAPQQLYTDLRYHNIGVPLNRATGVPKGAKIGLRAHVPSVNAGLSRPRPCAMLPRG